MKKWYLIPPCLTLSNIRYVSRVRWSNPGKEVAPTPTPRCSSYWKGAFWSPSTTVANFTYLLTYIYIKTQTQKLYTYIQIYINIHTNNEYPGYDIKQSDGEVPEMLELWGMQRTLSLPLLPGPLWLGMVAPERVLSQIELNCLLMLYWIVWNRIVLTFNRTVLIFNCL